MNPQTRNRRGVEQMRGGLFIFCNLKIKGAERGKCNLYPRIIDALNLFNLSIIINLKILLAEKLSSKNFVLIF